MIKTYYDDIRDAARDIKQSREERGLTQRQVADYLGVSQSYISQIERCHVPVSPRCLRELCKLYNVADDNKGYMLYSVDDLEMTYDLIDQLEREVIKWMQHYSRLKQELEARNGD